MGIFYTSDVGHVMKNPPTSKLESCKEFSTSILRLISTIYDYDDTMLLKEYHMMKKVQLIKNQRPLFQERTRGKNRSKSHYKEGRIWKK